MRAYQDAECTFGGKGILDQTGEVLVALVLAGRGEEIAQRTNDGLGRY